MKIVWLAIRVSLVLAAILLVLSLFAGPVALRFPELSTFLFGIRQSITMPLFDWFVGLFPSNTDETVQVIDNVRNVTTALGKFGEGPFVQLGFWVTVLAVILIALLVTTIRRNGLGDTANAIVHGIAGNPIPVLVLLLGGYSVYSFLKSPEQILQGMVPIIFILVLGVLAFFTRGYLHVLVNAIVIVGLVAVGMIALGGVFFPPEQAVALEEASPLIGKAVYLSSAYLYPQVTSGARAFFGGISLLVAVIAIAYFSRKSKGGVR